MGLRLTRQRIASVRLLRALKPACMLKHIHPRNLFVRCVRVSWPHSHPNTHSCALTVLTQTGCTRNDDTGAVLVDISQRPHARATVYELHRRIHPAWLRVPAWGITPDVHVVVIVPQRKQLDVFASMCCAHTMRPVTCSHSLRFVDMQSRWVETLFLHQWGCASGNSEMRPT